MQRFCVSLHCRGHHRRRVGCIPGQSGVAKASSTKHATQVFRSRVVHKPDKHIRAFAGETLSAITVLCWYFLLVMKPRNQLVEHGECLLVLQLIHDILFLLADKAVLLADKLFEVIVLHAKLMLRIYGTGMEVSCSISLGNVPHQLWCEPKLLQR